MKPAIASLFALGTTFCLMGTKTRHEVPTFGTSFRAESRRRRGVSFTSRIISPPINHRFDAGAFRHGIERYGGGGIDPDATVGDVRRAPCGEDMENLQAEPLRSDRLESKDREAARVCVKMGHRSALRQCRDRAQTTLVEIGTYNF